MIVKIESEVSALQFQLFTETGSTASSLQITAGSASATKESASNALLADLKISTLNQAAVTSVLENMKLVIAGTATTGTVEMTAEEYLTQIAIFLQLIELNLLDASIVTQSLALSNVKVTLSEAQISKLTLIQTSFTLVVTKITTIITTIQVSYKELTGAEATSIQISSGSSTVTDAKEASSALILSLKAITVNKGAVEKVEIALKEAAAGTLNGGEEIQGAAFLLLLEEFFSIIELDLESAAITALSFKIINPKVTLTAEQLTQITVFQTSIKVILIKITVAIEFFQSQVQTITGSTATSDQILAGDSSESITIATEGIVKILKVMTVNIKSIKKIKEMMKEISKDGISATAAGIEEVTNSKYLILVVKFFNMIAGNFIVSDLDMIINEILVAKLTVDLTELEKSDFEFIIVSH